MPSPLRALLLDMDGTLTEPMLDFPAIKAEMGIGAEPILEAMARMTARQRERAEAILLRHESAAAAGSTLAAGAGELLDWAEARGLRTGLITRNSRLSVETFLARHRLRIDTLISREDCRFKPDPAPLLLACERLGVAPAGAIMIGDGQYDVEAGNAAGVPSVWLALGRRRGFAAEPWREIEDLSAVVALLVGERLLDG